MGRASKAGAEPSGERLDDLPANPYPVPPARHQDRPGYPFAMNFMEVAKRMAQPSLADRSRRRTRRSI